MGAAEDRELAGIIAGRVNALGGSTYYVGGCVRDALIGVAAKDIDIEVHGISYESLLAILEELGTVRVTGASFGVFGLRHSDLDIAMPRKEEATGRGHKDFAVYTDPFIGPEKAAVRRDFTFNALMQDVLTGEILDFFGGRDDLEKGVIRHVNDESFKEDPLRVLRAAQFAARFNFHVAEETIRLCSEMDLTVLSRERIMTEMEKALLKSKNPSIFFETLSEMGQLDCWFPEVLALKGIPQNPKYHPEGDVWNHTMKTLDIAARFRESAKQPLYFMISALCHDFGKAVTTEEIDGQIHAYRHEVEGEGIIRAFLARLTSENELTKYVVNMTLLHMRPNMLAGCHSSRKAYMHMFDEAVEPSDLLLLAKSDYLGSTGQEEYSGTEQLLLSNLERYRELMDRPFVKGADLVAAGIKPGPEFREALEYAHKLRLAGVKKDQAMIQTLGYIRAMGNTEKNKQEENNENLSGM